MRIEYFRYPGKQHKDVFIRDVAEFLRSLSAQNQFAVALPYVWQIRQKYMEENSELPEGWYLVQEGYFFNPKLDSSEHAADKEYASLELDQINDTEQIVVMPIRIK